MENVNTPFPLGDPLAWGETKQNNTKQHVCADHPPENVSSVRCRIKR